LIADRVPIIYQPTFETPHYATACDIFVWNRATNAYDLYEVKASTNGDDKTAKDALYAADIAFQTNVLRQCGVPLGSLYLIRLNSEYVRDNHLDIATLFSKEDFTERVTQIAFAIASKMEEAFDFLVRSTQPVGPCGCIEKGRSSHCTTFNVTNPDVPEYSVHDISRIGASKRKLAQLVDGGILAITDVPDDFQLTDKQMIQVQSAKTGKEVIDADTIRSFLASLHFPLSFIDYETYPAAIPRFSGYRPFDQIPFQFSLDVTASPDSSFEHHELIAIFTPY
jgi:hypothetical protein